MTRIEKIEKALVDAGKLQKALREVMAELKDYDLERILKKVDAELMDVQHNLGLAKTKLEEKSKTE